MKQICPKKEFLLLSRDPQEMSINSIKWHDSDFKIWNQWRPFLLNDVPAILPLSDLSAKVWQTNS